MVALQCHLALSCIRPVLERRPDPHVLLKFRLRRLVRGGRYAIECKSLRFDRTYGEVGKRLAEYSAGTVEEKRTPLQKHLDRMSCLKANRERLADFTSISVARLQLRSGLVTEKLVSMQFGGTARKILDLVTDYELLEEAFPDR